VGIKVTWDDPEQHTIRYIFAGEWNWGEVFSAINISDSWLNEREQKTPFIIDLRKSDDKVAEKSLGNVRRLVEKAHPHTGLIVIVGFSQSPVIQLTKSILAMLERISTAKRTFYFADTLDDARSIISKKIDFA